MSSTSARTISNEHRAYLHDAAISDEVINDFGIYSASGKEALPEKLRETVHAFPGIVFPKPSVGSAEAGFEDFGIWPQYRPDNPGDEGPKYIGAKGSGGYLSIAPSQRHLLAKKGVTVLIVEGTKQHLAALSALGLDSATLVAGVEGCWGWSTGSAPSRDLNELAAAAGKVVVAFDADITTNPNVYDAGAALVSALPTCRVAFVAVPGGKSTGLDDALARVPSAERRTYFEALIKGARPLSKRRPKPVTNRGRAHIDLDRLEIGFVETTEKGKETWNTLTDFVVTVDEVRTAVHDLMLGTAPKPETLATVTFRRRVDGRVIERSCTDVPYAALHSLTMLLDYLGGATVAVKRPTDLAGEREVLQAIRETAPDEQREELFRTGYVEVDGRLAYLTPKGALLADGMTGAMTARLSGGLERLDLADTSSMRASEVRAAWEANLHFARERFSRPEVPVILLGYATLVLTGVRPHGSVGVFGKPGSGKTTAFRWVADHFWREREVHAIISATANAAGALGQGLHQMPFVLDDARPSAMSRRDEETNEGVMSQIRHAYDGPTSAKSRLGAGESKTEQAAKRGEWHGLILGGERLPMDASADSTRQRILTVHVAEGESILESSSVEGRVSPDLEFAEHAEAGYPRVVAGSLLQHFLGEMETLGEGLAGQRAFAARVDEARAALAAALLAQARKQVPEMLERQAEVAAAPLAGYALYLRTAVHFGAMTEAQVEAEMEAAKRLVLEAAIAHHRRYVAPATLRWMRVVDVLREAVASDRARLAESDGRAESASERARANVPVIGKVLGTGDVALLPAAAVEVLRRAPEFVGVAEAQVENLLEAQLLRDGGRARRQARIGGQRVRCWVLPQDVWADPVGASDSDAGGGVVDLAARRGVAA